MAARLQRQQILLSTALLLPVLAALLAPAPAAAEGGSLRRFGAQVDISGQDLPGVIAAGAQVSLKGSSTGRVMLAGADVGVDATVQAPAYVVAAEARLGGDIAGDLSVYGGHIEVGSAVDGDFSALGSRVEIAKSGKIAGRSDITAASVAFAGQSGGQLSIDGDTVDFNGTAKSGVRIEALVVRIGADADITGDADIYTIGTPSIDEHAKIHGHVTTHSLPEASGVRAFSQAGLIAQLLPLLFLAGSALVAGLLFLWLGRGGAEGTIDELIDSPGVSGLWGIATIVLMPIAAVLLSLTIIGAPVGALALLTLPLLLLLGYASASLGLGEWMFNRLGEPRSAGLRALHLLAGLVVLGILGLVPWAGPALLAIATLCGLGAFLRTLHDRMRGAARV